MSQLITEDNLAVSVDQHYWCNSWSFYRIEEHHEVVLTDRSVKLGGEDWLRWISHPFWKVNHGRHPLDTFKWKRGLGLIEVFVSLNILFRGSWLFVLSDWLALVRIGRGLLSLQWVAVGLSFVVLTLLSKFLVLGLSCRCYLGGLGFSHDVFRIININPNFKLILHHNFTTQFSQKYTLA